MTIPIEDRLHSLFDLIDSNLFIPTEYICLPDFLVTGSDVIAESSKCTLFNVRKIYGWDAFSRSYALNLFDANVNPTVGVWQNDCLTLYQDIPMGYLRLSYLVKKSQELMTRAKNGDRLKYSFFVDLSTDGIQWHRYSHGKYQAD